MVLADLEVLPALTEPLLTVLLALLLRLKLFVLVVELPPNRNGCAGEKTESLLIELTEECGDA